MKKYNVWTIIEEIDDEKEDSGKDTSVRKLAWFKKLKDAEKFIENICVEE